MNLDVIKSALSQALSPEGLDPSTIDPATYAEVQSLMAARQSLPPILQQESLLDALEGADQPTEPPAEGTLLAGRYRLGPRVASSALSLVYLAADERLADNRVVVKFLRQSGARLATVQALIRNEIVALARLRHPGVAGLIDAGQSDGGAYFVVLQYLPGQSLRSLLEQRAVPPHLCRAVVQQVGATLDAAHQAGIVHCDLKPENILVDLSRGNDIRVSVVDFGIAVTRSELSGEPHGGTAAYAAPEQLRGQISPRVDVYALAKITAELYPQASGRLRRAITQGLAAEPALRPPTPGAFVRSVTAAIDGRRRRAIILVSAATAVLLLAMVLARGGAQKRVVRNPKLQPLTALKGVEVDPSFSFDGSRILYSHGVGQNEPRRLMMMDMAGAASRPLTFGPGMDRRPVSSSDGSRIAYIHEDGAGPGQIRILSSDGRIRTIHSGDIQSLTFGRDPGTLYWTEWLAPNAKGTIRRMQLDSGQMETYPPPPDCKGDIDAAVSPDGKKLAFVRYESSEIGELHIVGLDPNGRLVGTPVGITSLRRRIFSPAWYPNGEGLLFVAGSLTNRTLWKVRIGPRGQTEVEELSEYGDQIEQVAISRGNQLAVVKNKEDADIWEFRLRSDGVADPSTPPRRVFSSTTLDEEAMFSPDGRRIGFFSERSGQLQAWVAGAGGTGLTQVTSFERAEKAWLAWSPSGVLSVMARLPGLGPVVYRLESGATEIREVFRAPPNQRVIGICRDGQCVYVTADSNVDKRLERWWLGTGRKELVARTEAGFLRESPDSDWIYFTRRQASSGLYRMPRSGGREELVAPSLNRRNTFALRNGWLYYAAPTPQLGIYALRLSDNFRTLLFRLERPPGWGMDVSPDGRRLLVPLFDFDDADVYLSATLP